MNNAPPHWERTTIGQLGRYLNGRAFKSSEWGPSGRPIVRIQNLTGSGSEFNYFDGDVEDRYVIRPGDLLVSWAATLGVYFWDGPEAVLNQHIFKVETFIDRGFHKYLIESKIAEMMAQTHGSGMVHITKGKFESVPVALPPLDEQQRIVAVLEEHLSRLDRAQSGLQRTGHALQALHSSALNALECGSTIRLPNSQTIDGRATLPSGWRQVRLHDVTVGGKDGFKRGPFGSALTKASFVDSGYKVYEQYCAINDDPSFGRYYISPDHYERLRSFSVESGDFLVSGAGTLGRITQVTDAFEPGVINQALLRIRIDRSMILDEFFLWMFRSPRFQRKLIKGTSGTAMVNLKAVKELKEIEISLPPISDQAKLVEKFHDIHRAQARLVNSIELASSRAVHLRRSLFAAAFSGQLTREFSDV